MFLIGMLLAKQTSINGSAKSIFTSIVRHHSSTLTESEEESYWFVLLLRIYVFSSLNKTHLSPLAYNWFC